MVTLERSAPPLPAIRRRAAIHTMPEVRWAAASLALFALGGVAHLAGLPAPIWWTLYLACYAAGGWEPTLSGLQALKEKTLDVDILMIVAALLAASIGQVFDGALLIVIFATSGALEAFVGIFGAAIQVAGPVLLALILTDAAFGMVSRVVPQLNVFAVGFAAKIIVGLLILAVTLPFLAGWLSDELEASVSEALRMLRVG